MAGNLEEKAGSSITCAATGSTSSLNNAAAVAATAGGGNLTNSTGLNYSAIARLTAACVTNPGEGVTVSLYLVPVADGTNAATADTSTPYISPNYFVGFFYWPGTATATTYTMDIPDIPLEAYDYKPYLINNLGQTISSGWGLIFYPSLGQYT